MMFAKVKKVFAKLTFWGEGSGTKCITNSVLHETVTVPVKLEHIMCVVIVPVKCRELIYNLREIFGFFNMVEFPSLSRCRKRIMIL